MYRYFLLISILAFIPEAYSSQRDNISISSINVVSKVRRTNLTSQGIVRLYLPYGAWGTSDCRPTAADIIPEDDHIYAAALAAYMGGKKVLISIDTGVKPHDDVCKVEAIHIK